MSTKKKIIIIITICLIGLVAGFVADKLMSKNYFNEIKYDEMIKKIENKESFILLLSQTTCSHCAIYKPKLERIANREKVYVYYMEVDLLKTENQEHYNDLNARISFDSTPVTVFFIDGEEKTAANRINGNASSEKIVNKLKSNGFIK